MTIVCDICGNVYKDKHPGYFTGTICNECYNLKDIDELKKVVKQRIERTKKRLKVLEELGFEMTEIKGDLDSIEELLEKEVVVAVFKKKIINFFTKVSTLETRFLFTGMEDKIPEFINENEILTNETKELKNQVKNLKDKEIELTAQIDNLSKEIEEMNENTDTLTNENKKLKNQINQLESLKGKEVESTDQINNLNKEIEELKEYINTVTNENKELKNQINQLMEHEVLKASVLDESILLDLLSGSDKKATHATNRIKNMPDLDKQQYLDNITLRLKDKNNKVKCERAAEALGKIGDPKAVAPLIAALLTNVYGSVRGKAAEALGKIGDPKAVAPLRAALDDNIISVRRNAAKALKEIEAKQK